MEDWSQKGMGNAEWGSTQLRITNSSVLKSDRATLVHAASAGAEDSPEG